MRCSKVVLVALLVVLAVPAAASAGIPQGGYAMGDSVMLGARTQLIARGFRVNADVSRLSRRAGRG